MGSTHSMIVGVKRTSFTMRGGSMSNTTSMRYIV